MTVGTLWRLWTLLMVAAVLAWTLWVDGATGGPGGPLVRPATRLPELPPAPAFGDAAASVEALSRATIWGPRAAAAAPGASVPVAAPTWSVSGFYEASGVRHVIVSYDNAAAPSQQLKVGERLPDGARILAIEPDRIQVRHARPVTTADGKPAPRTGWVAISPGLSLPRR